MDILGFELSLKRKQAAPLAVVDDSSRSWFRILESRAGAWQTNTEIDTSLSHVVANPVLNGCLTLLSGSVAKLEPQLLRRNRDGVWLETSSTAYSPVLREPNRYSNRQQFLESWLLSKLQHGNAYILKARNARGVVTEMYVLDPLRVTPLVAPNADVYYQLKTDNLSAITEEVIVPSSEIIHDRAATLFHPLIGIPPLLAAAIPASGGLSILNNSATFFQNSAMPSGLLVAPGTLSTETASRLKTAWEAQFQGENVGRVAILGDGLSFTPLTMSSSDAQMVEHLRLSSESICSAFRVPGWLVGVGGTMPAFGNVESAMVSFYSTTIQSYATAVELCLSAGLGLPSDLKVAFDLTELLRTDTKSMIESLAAGVKAAIFSPNEARRRLGLPAVAGGDSPLAQVQDHSLAALARRDEAQAAPAIIPTAEPASAAERGLKPRLRHRGDWNAKAAYGFNDCATYAGGLWRCLVSHLDPGYGTPGPDMRVCWQRIDE